MAEEKILTIKVGINGFGRIGRFVFRASIYRPELGIQVVGINRQGDVVGTVTLTIQGEVIGTADLIAGSDVSRNQVLYTLSRVSLFFSSTYFKVVIALTIFVVGCYGIYIAGRVLLASRKTR